MILSYSLDRFVDMIQDGTKIHTIRTDAKRRWRPGMKIQHWRGNPRNVRNDPYKFAEGECRGVQDIQITRGKGDVPIVWIRGYFLAPFEVKELASNDGLSVEEFREWFVPVERPVFKGRVIHFTDQKY